MRKAFSMLELVVVMAILAVIAAVVFPVFGQTVRKAHETGCLSNVRQVYLAAQLYRQDQGDYPNALIDNPIFLPYLSGTVLKCPAAKPGWPSYTVSASRAPIAELMPNPSYKAGYKALLACWDKRGSDMPVVLDENHSTKEEGYRTGERFFILARESGAVVRVPHSLIDAMLDGKIAMPCDRIVLDENL